MKQLFTLLLLSLIAAAGAAQTADTLLYEDFQTDKFGEWGTVPLGDDANWVTFDEDGLNPYDSDDSHRAWYNSQFFYNSEDSITGYINYCATSLSYMEGFATGNRNWLITPPIHVSDANFTLHWKSAPFQLPRYMDGYLVMAAEGTNDLFSGAFQDTLFQAASMESVVGDGESILLHNYTFTPGYIHADSLRNEDYVDLYAPDDSTLLRGILEPHSVSLAPYVGKTVYFAFLHNSDDDYFIAIDDVLITRTQVSAANAPSADEVRFTTYPNPVTNNLNVLYRLSKSEKVSVRLTDMNGKMVFTTPEQLQVAGEQQINLNLVKLPAGAYTVTLQIGNQAFGKMMVKK